MSTPDNLPWMHAHYAHIRIPKALLYHSDYFALSPDAILLYGLMMDRASLSLRFGGQRFRLADGTVTIIFTQEEIMKVLKCKRDKARRITKELSENHLIRTKRMGLGKPNQITVIPVDWANVSWKDSPINPPADAADISHSHDDISGTNNTDINNIDMNDPDTLLAQFSYDTLKRQVNYDRLISRFDRPTIDAILEILSMIAPLPEIALSNNCRLKPEQFISSIQQSHIAYTANKLLKTCDTSIDSDLFILQTLQEATQLYDLSEI